MIKNSSNSATPGRLYLIPVSLSEGNDPQYDIPAGNTAILNNLSEFVCENERTARRFLRAMGFTGNFDEVTLHVLDKHTRETDLPEFLARARQGNDIGLLSEAGNPCIADPGQMIVKLAHLAGIRVIPLVGPSSILLALISSGFNGQHFIFHGYLPIERNKRIAKIRDMEQAAQKLGQTQIFMETPYRNNGLLEDLIKTCKPTTPLCIASNITAEDEFIRTLTVGHWKQNTPDLHKKPTVFLIYK